MTDAILELHGLSKHFGGIAATDHVDLRICRGGVHAIIGPNGAGKTTLIAQLSGALRPDSGKVFFDGRDVTRQSVARRARRDRPFFPVLASGAPRCGHGGRRSAGVASGGFGAARGLCGRAGVAW